jgi:predicted ATPase/DNA-binding SARP family transcriptional activator
MELGLLGPVTITTPEVEVDFDERARALLAVLALAGAVSVPPDELAQRLWAGAVPPDPATALEVLLGQLASVLPEGAVLRTDAGHQLDAALVTTDVDRFDDLVAAAARARAEGSPGRGIDTLTQALGIWRGSALADARLTPYLEAEAARLDEARLTTLEDCRDLGLHQGPEPGLVDDVRRLVEEHPTRERLWAVLMTALYLGGRRDEAIQVYAEARERLAAGLGLEPGEALRQLEAGILRNDPPLPGGSRHLLPVRPRARARIPPLINKSWGRADLTTQVGDLLGRPGVRLVTLTGIGGAGKSRVATLVATAVQHSFADVVYLQVTEATPSGQLAIDVMLSLGCEPGDDLREALAGLAPDRRVLVVLDNLEALAEAGDLVDTLLASSPALTVLVTSRLPLHVTGEHELPVPPLDIPDPTTDIATIAGSASVDLFVDRATSVDASFALAGQEYVVAEICVMLDGLPLAIELAAARVKVLSLDQISEGLSTGLDLLGGGAMATAIRWSYDRLDPAGRLVCDRLALFERGFTVEAVEAVCPDVASVIEALASIVDARLVRATRSRVGVRFVVLGTVRAFAREQLLARADVHRSRELLAAHLTARVTSSALRLYGPDADLTLARFDDDAADIAAAIDWALEAGRRAVAVELALASLDCWISAGRHNEALARTRRVLEHVSQTGADAARLHAAVAMLAYHLSDFDETQAHSRVALELAERHSDRTSAAVARLLLGATLVYEGELDEGTALAEYALAEAEKLDLYPLSTQCLSVLAMAKGIRRDYEGERRMHEERLVVVRAKGDLARTADTLNTLAEIALDEADGDGARMYATESYSIAEPRLPMECRDASITLARAALVLGDLGGAATKLAHALDLSDRLGQAVAVAQCLRVAGCLAAGRDDADAAVRFFAAAHSLAPPAGGSEQPPEQDLAAALGDARHALGPHRARHAWTIGRALPLPVVRAQLAALLDALPQDAGP